MYEIQLTGAEMPPAVKFLLLITVGHPKLGQLRRPTVALTFLATMHE